MPRVRFERQLVVNPGAAGPRRFDIQPSVAVLTIADGMAEVEIGRMCTWCSWYKALSRGTSTSRICALPVCRKVCRPR